MTRSSREAVELVGGIGAKVGSRKKSRGREDEGDVRGKEGRQRTRRAFEESTRAECRVSLFVVPFKFSSGEAEAESLHTAFKPVLVGRQRSFSLSGDTFQANSGSRLFATELANVERRNSALETPERGEWKKEEGG